METDITEGSEITQINSREASESSVEADKSEYTAESSSTRGEGSLLTNGYSNLSDKAILLEDKFKLPPQSVMDLEKELVQASEKEEQVVLLEGKPSKAEKKEEDALVEAPSLTRELSNSASEGLQFKGDAKLSENLGEKTENTLALIEKESVLQEQFTDVELKRKEVEDKLNVQTQLLQEEMKIRALKEVELHDAKATLGRLEMDLTHFQEKVVCLERQLKCTVNKTEENEKLAKQNEDTFVNSFERALELDNLCVISESRAKEMERVVISLQEYIQWLHGKLASYEQTQELLNETEAKLFKVEEQLKHSQEQVSEFSQQSRMTELDLSNKELEGHLSFGDRRGMDTRCRGGQFSEEDSLARVMKIETAPLTSSHKENELQESLHVVKEKSSSYEDIAKNSTERLFEVDNLAGVLAGILKDTQDKLDVLGLDLKNASEREIELQTKLKHAGEQFSAQESIVQHATARCMELEQLLESQANDTEMKLLEAKKNQSDLEVRNLREKLNAFRLLVEESDNRAACAYASAVERQVDLEISYAKLADTEILLRDLQDKILVAEGRAQNAEAECTALAEKASKVNEELGHLQSYIDELQTALHQAESEKLSAAEQVSSATKSINDLTRPLAEERQLLKTQISIVVKDNNDLIEKYSRIKNELQGFLSQYESELKDTNERETIVLKGNLEDLKVRLGKLTRVDKHVAGLEPKLQQVETKLLEQDIQPENLHLKGTPTSAEAFGSNVLSSDLMGVNTTGVSLDQAVPRSNVKMNSHVNFTGCFHQDFKLTLVVVAVSVVIGLIIGRIC